MPAVTLHEVVAQAVAGAAALDEEFSHAAAIVADARALEEQAALIREGERRQQEHDVARAVQLRRTRTRGRLTKAQARQSLGGHSQRRGSAPRHEPDGGGRRHS
eukprot:gene56433-59401_t